MCIVSYTKQTSNSRLIGSNATIAHNEVQEEEQVFTAMINDLLVSANRSSESDSKEVLCGAFGVVGTRPDSSVPLRNALLNRSIHPQLAHQTGRWLP